MKTIRQEFIEAAAKSSSMACTQIKPKARKRTKKQMRKDERIIKRLIDEGMKNPKIANATGLTLKQVELQISRGKLRAKAKRKPRIVYAKPTFWQKIKKTISNIWG